MVGHPCIVLDQSLYLPFFPLCRLLDWRERRTDGPKRMKNERIIVFKHLFDPKEFEVRDLMTTGVLVLSCAFM